MRLPALLLVLASVVLGQQAPQGQAPEPPKKARLEGVVVSLAGQPVPRAQVRLAGTLSVQAGQVVQPTAFGSTTDDAGKFAIENIDPGSNYTLTAQRTGFVNARYGARSATGPATPLAIEAGQSLKGITVTMTPQAVITGRVVDAAGDPVQNSLVLLMRRGYQRGVRTLLPGNTSQTNDQGEFRIANLTPGRYYLMAQGRPLIEALTSTGGGPAQPMGPISTYYPNGTDPQQAAPIDVTAGQELRGMEIRLQQGRVFTIRGKAVGVNGGPVGQGNLIMAVPKSIDANSILILTSRAQAAVRPDGSFELRNLMPGQFVLQAITTQGGAPKTMGRMELAITDSDINGLTFPLMPGPSITGKIRVEDGEISSLTANTTATQQNATLAIAASQAGVPVSGVRVSVALTEVTPTGINGPPGQMQDDGSFTIDGVGLSTYMLNVGALPQGYYVKTARFNGTDVTHTTIDTTNGAGGTMEILLSSKAADVVGTVQTENNAPNAGLMVTLWTKDADPGTTTNGIRNATTDQNGTFTFKGLRPGVYYAAAWEDLESGLNQARDFLNLMTNEATKIEISEGGHSAAQVRLVPVAKIKAAEEKLP